MDILQRFVDEEFISKGNALHQLYFNFIQKTYGKNFCYSIDTIVLFSFFDKSKKLNEIKSIVEKMMNCETRFTTIYTIENGFNLIYNTENNDNCLKEKNKNLFRQRGPILININIADKIIKCFNDGYDGYAVSLMVYDHIDLCDFDYKSMKKNKICIGHSVIMYIDFRCNSVILFNSNEIDNIYDLQYLFNFDPEFQKIANMISIRTGGGIMKFFSEKTICPSLNIQSIQGIINEDFGGTCLLWSMYLFNKYVSRYDKDCDYSKFYVNLRFPIISYKRFESLMKFYYQYKNYFQNIDENKIKEAIRQYNEYENNKEEFLFNNKNNIIELISFIKKYPYLREQINPQILQSLDYISHILQLSMMKMQENRIFVEEMRELMDKIDNTDDPEEQLKIQERLLNINKKFKTYTDKLSDELKKLSKKETFVYTLILWNVGLSFINILYSINFNYEIAGFFNELLQYRDTINKTGKIRIILTQEEVDMINNDNYYLSNLRRYLNQNTLRNTNIKLNEALDLDVLDYKKAVSTAISWIPNEKKNQGAIMLWKYIHSLSQFSGIDEIKRDILISKIRNEITKKTFSHNI